MSAPSRERWGDEAFLLLAGAIVWGLMLSEDRSSLVTPDEIRLLGFSLKYNLLNAGYLPWLAKVIAMTCIWGAYDFFEPADRGCPIRREMWCFAGTAALWASSPLTAEARAPGLLGAMVESKLSDSR
jgi:hypothetical protein